MMELLQTIHSHSITWQEYFILLRMCISRNPKYDWHLKNSKNLCCFSLWWELLHLESFTLLTFKTNKKMLEKCYANSIKYTIFSTPSKCFYVKNFFPNKIFLSATFILSNFYSSPHLLGSFFHDDLQGVRGGLELSDTLRQV